MISRKYACQNLRVRQWSLWKQRPTDCTQLLSMIQFSSAQYLLWNSHDCFILNINYCFWIHSVGILTFLHFQLSTEELVIGWCLGFYRHEQCQPWAGHGLDYHLHLLCAQTSWVPQAERDPRKSLLKERTQSWVQTTLHKPVSFWALEAMRAMPSSWYPPPAPQEATLRSHPRSPCPVILAWGAWLSSAVQLNAQAALEHRHAQTSSPFGSCLPHVWYHCSCSIPWGKASQGGLAETYGVSLLT